MIDVDGLTVRFSGVTALDDLTVSFDAQSCGLIGPNGAGKSTFLNVLSGFVKPTSGRVRAFGENLLALPHYKRARWGVRRSFQTEQAIEELSVFDNVALVQEHADTSRSDRHAVTAVLELVGLAAMADDKVSTLSAGDRRLVEVARAAAGNPRVVLLDEPAAGLPDEESERLSDIIRAIPEVTGAQVLLVEHDMSLVSACCEQTAVIDYGKLVVCGPTEDVLRDERVVRAYLGEEVWA